MANIAGVILAAGQGNRLGGDVPKQFMELNGRPVLEYSIEAFEQSSVDDIFIVADEEHAEDAQKVAMKFKKVRNIIIGGEERSDSVYNALDFLNDRFKPDIVLIHDSARPFVTYKLIETIIEETKENGAAIAAMPSKDTIKVGNGEGFISQTLPRSESFLAQTPQGFNFTLIWEAYDQIIGGMYVEYDEEDDDDEEGEDIIIDGDSDEIVVTFGEGGEMQVDGLFDESFMFVPEITDDAGVFELAFPGKYIKLVEGGYENFKITTKEDMEYAEFLMKKNN